jgi:hypothetical protein
MSVRISLAMLLAAATAACASAPTVQEQASTAIFQGDAFKTDAAVGHKIDEAIAANGPPASQWDLPDGRRAFQWQEVSLTATVGAARGDGALVGGASQTTCYYTLYARPDAKGLYKVVGFDQPRPGCGRLAMNGQAPK